MVVSLASPVVTWELLPDDFILPNDPVDNIDQPALAAALTESLELAGKLPQQALAMTNYGICATLDGKVVAKAPDWGYVPKINVSREAVRRSYTPQLQGEKPTIVMEFLSDTEAGEYSIKPTYPPGKWYFYERILQVPNYILFELSTELLESYRLDDSGQYRLQSLDSNNRHWIPEMNLFLGLWHGTRENRTGFWLRWWDQQGALLLWGTELAQQERQLKEAAQQRTERLAAKLQKLGIDPSSL
jgi:hypothetical protein